VNDFTQLVDLAAERLGGRVLDANDDFFAPKENLLKEAEPVFIDGKYTTRGKWMDGWETRRRRAPGHDWCVIRLGLPGRIRGVVVDTSFFTGNFPERFSLEGCDLDLKASYKDEAKRLGSAKTGWIEILPETRLRGNSQNSFPVEDVRRFTHLRLRIYPDGGVARLRVHGEAAPDLKRLGRGEIDLVAAENGGSPLAASDQHYGLPRNLLMPYRARNMGDGWETRRRRGPGHDWVILRLGIAGTIHRIEVDTAHFKGNYPDSCSLEVSRAAEAGGADVNLDSLVWEELLPKSKLKPNHRHAFSNFSKSLVATHARFQIFPDGGVSRLRLFGHPEIAVDPAASLERLNRLALNKAVQEFLDCCGSRKWAKAMAQGRPYATHTDLFVMADRLWLLLGKADWLETFHHHPPIGGTRARAKRSAAASRWSIKEQSASQKASPEILASLAAENRTYAEKFGYVFLISATGKTSEEILQALRRRLPNDAETEWRAAAEEQRQITRLRLEKLLTS